MSRNHAGTKSAVVDLLHAHPDGLTRNAIMENLQARGRDIDSCLRDLRVESSVFLANGGRWCLRNVTHPETVSAAGSAVAKPPIAEQRPEDLSKQSLVSEPVRHDFNGSRWQMFRRLCLYYRECLRAEAVQKVDTYSEQANKRFIALPPGLNWAEPKHDKVMQIEMAEDWAEFIRYTKRNGRDSSLFVGAPIWVRHGKRRDDGESFTRYYPVFLHAVDLEVKGRQLQLRFHGRWEINHSWLVNTIRTVADRQPLLELMGIDNPDASPALSQLYDQLTAFYRDWWKVHGTPDQPASVNVLEGAKGRGLFNSVLLFVQPKFKYTWRLADELKKIAYEASDEQLDSTALSHLFPHDRLREMPPRANRSGQQSGGESHVFEIEHLNAEQRQAAKFAIAEPLSVVFGPPGTGKSRVVSQVLAEGVLRGQPTLFASHNHQALDAVVPKLNAMTEPRPIVVNLAVRYGEGSGQTNMLTAVNELLCQSTALEGSSPRLQLHQELGGLAGRLSALEAQLDRVSKERSTLHQNLTQFTQLAESVGPSLRNQSWNVLSLNKKPPPIDDTSAKKCLALFEASENISSARSLTRVIHRIILRLRLAAADRSLRTQLRRLTSAEIAPSKEDPLTQAQFEHWHLFLELMKCASRVQKLRKSLDQQPHWTDLLRQVAASREQLLTASRKALAEVTRSIGSEAAGPVRQQLAEMRAELASAPQPLPAKEERRLGRMLEARIGTLLDLIPAWSTTNLSAGRDLPLTPGQFDLVVIDEASQCDIPSVLPLLFRAKRAMFVGDPLQLRHVSQIPKDTHHYLRQQAGLDNTTAARFLYPENSILDLAHSDENMRHHVQLVDHHRSHPDIADFCNDCFNRGRLNVLTDASSLRPVKTAGRQSAGLLWSHLDSDVESPGKGAISRNQIEAIIAELRRLRDAHYAGTVGVVTPFRHQANRIRDKVLEKLGAMPEHWEFKVDTADGFQGGERDVMMLSIPAGPEMPQGAARFLAGEPNRFNVAVSRARSLLHVFADRNWAKSCGIAHIRALAFACEKLAAMKSEARTDLVGPVWEPRFGEALKEAGLPVQSQYPVLGRYYLDFALVGNDKKIAIEVDGEQWHRDPSGDRKIEDVRRDQLLVAAGWQVRRFWVYQLREDMDGCVQEIKGEWE